jgi:hypothetical protein
VLSSSTTTPRQQPQQQQQQQEQQQQQLRSHVQLAVADYTRLLKDSQLHAVLTTSAWGLLGLAHLLQQLQAQGEDLPIHTYCTEPCLHFYQQMSQELLDTASASAGPAALQTTQKLQQQQEKQQQEKQQQGALPVPALHQMTLLQQQVQQALNQHNQLQQQQQQQQALQQQPTRQPPQPSSDQPGAAAAPTATSTAAAAGLASSASLHHVPLFSAEQLQSVLDAVQIVRFGQRVQLPGWCDLVAEARPSGSGIGSCLWRLSCGDQRWVTEHAFDFAGVPCHAQGSPAGACDGRSLML